MYEEHDALIRVVASTGSTNADMVELARAGAVEGSWLRARCQTAGRGRQRRAWVSPDGNFYASTLVRMRSSDPAPATLALVAAVALEEVVSIFAADLPGLSLKWPNDLLLNDAKLSGILLERIDDAVVIGVGVNLMHHPVLPDRTTTSLAAHGIMVPPADFLDILVEATARWVACWRREGMGPVRDRWLARAHPVGTALKAQMPDGVAVDGLFDGLDVNGALNLRLAGGERRVIHAADVFLLRG